MVWLRRIGSVLVVVTAATVVAACDPDPHAPVESPRSRLLALEDLWFASPATITYRTTERDPGEATSPHQCLRQLVEIDVQIGLRICSGVGEIRLAWDPPDRWRMDGTSPDGGFTLLSTPDDEVRCRGSEVTASACFATETSGRFASVVEAPERILAELGASGGSVVLAGARRTIAGIPAECFRAIGGSAESSHRVEWCFSQSGLLLYLFDWVEGGRVTTVEATDVSEVVANGDFVVPSI
ncbi:MAG TPA: hypothetical protein VFT76_00950 [Actinomycetota bacterium]|nr:hypothetical protein [Actinomycetota bacterium]